MHNLNFSFSGFSAKKLQGNWIFSTNRCSIRGKNPLHLIEVLKGKDNKDDNQEIYYAEADQKCYFS